MNLKARWRLLKIAFELHDQGTSCCGMLTSPGEGSAGNRCRACPGEGSTGSRQQATRRGWRQARPRALVRASGAQERPVWPVGSVCLARPRALVRAPGAAPTLYMLFSVFLQQERVKEARVLKGVFPISSLGLRGSSLRLFLVFGTPFFHLVITYQLKSLGHGKRFGKMVEFRKTLNFSTLVNLIVIKYEEALIVERRSLSPRCRFINTELGKQYLVFFIAFISFSFG
ncbi:hypothetical protein QL285_014371 [Trifolium repens]|nr:hypothetical protein QL285_014371 [Trifolium repens]